MGCCREAKILRTKKTICTHIETYGKSIPIYVSEKEGFFQFLIRYDRDLHDIATVVDVFECPGGFASNVSSLICYISELDGDILANLIGKVIPLSELLELREKCPA